MKNIKNVTNSKHVNWGADNCADVDDSRRISAAYVTVKYCFKKQNNAVSSG